MWVGSRAQLVINQHPYATVVLLASLVRTLHCRRAAIVTHAIRKLK